MLEVRRRRPLLPHALFVVLAAGALCPVSGCANSIRQSLPPQQEHRTIAEGYSLLYGITSQQKNVGKILLIKSESDAVRALITSIAAYATELSEELESMAQRYPALRIDTQFLPEVEVKARESTGDDIGHELLHSSGKTFERQLLHSQLDALDQERHIARVMVRLEESDARRPFWTRTQKRLDELHADVAELLARDCAGR